MLAADLLPLIQSVSLPLIQFVISVYLVVSTLDYILLTNFIDFNLFFSYFLQVGGYILMNLINFFLKFNLYYRDVNIFDFYYSLNVN